jgi:nitrate/nitrite transporter NarK
MNAQPGAKRALFLSTTAFAVAFAAWGLLSGLAPIFRQQSES